MRYRSLAVAALLTLSVAACQPSSDEGRPLEMPECAGAFASFEGLSSWEDTTSVQDTLGACQSRDEWIEQAVAHVDSPYAGDPAAAGEVLDSLCADGQFPGARACRD